MTRRVVLSLAAGLAVGAAAFVVVLLATRSDASPTSAPRPVASARAAADVRGGRLVFAEMGCGSCHRLAAAGSNGQIGPVLDQVLSRHTRASLAAKIADPAAGTIMPQDFGRRMSPAQLQALLDFLVAARDGRAGS
jgi:mono/diheme cytochrome c family protein